MRIRTRSLIIITSQGITQATTLILSLIIVRIVTQDTFGSYRQALLAYSTLTALFSLQLEQSLYYFVPRLGGERRGSLLTHTLGLTTAVTCAVGFALYFGAGTIADLLNNPSLAPAIRVLAILPLVDRISFLVPSFMLSIDRAVRGSTYSLITGVGRVSTVAIAFGLGADLPEVFTYMIAMSSTIALVGCIDMVRLSRGGTFAVDSPLLREQLAYALPLWLTSGTGILNREYDKFLISANFDPTTYAVYFCGAMELPVVLLVTSSLSTAIMPNLVSLGAENRTREMLTLWNAAARKASLALFPCFAFFMAIRLDLMVLLYGEDYARAADPFGIYLLSLPLRVGIYAAILRATGRTREVAIGAVVMLLVNVSVSTSLVWLGGQSNLAFIGPAIGTVAATFAAVIFLLTRLRKVVALPIAKLMRWRELALTLALCVAAGAATAVLPVAELGLVARLVVRTGFFGLALLGLVWLTGALEEDELQMLRHPIRSLRERDDDDDGE